MKDQLLADHAARCSRATCLKDLEAADAALDRAVAGACLAVDGGAGHLEPGAHEPTPTPYFILAELLGNLDLGPDSHVLDVGCGAGRVLAYAAAADLPCRVTGVELGGALASRAASWVRKFDRLDVVSGSVLDIRLDPYSHFYLFNPFDSDVLAAFLDRIEEQAVDVVTLVHMSDNGESFGYLGRLGWTRLKEGSFHMHPSASGGSFSVFGCPQHYTIWRYDPSAGA